MTTIARTEPCGSCVCCQAGKRCAYVLELHPADRAILARLEALGFGKSDGTIHRAPAAITAERRVRREPPEPTASLKCERCGDPFEVLAFIVETFKTRGFTPRRCDGCRHAGKERADLA